METVFFIIECLGVVSFAASTSVVAVEKNTDAVGALVLSMLTVFGGGLIRDLLLGITPPHLFWDHAYWGYAAVITPVTLLCFHLAFFPRTAFLLEQHKNSFVINLLDTVGLSVFCIAGVNVALESGFMENRFLAVFSGCVTGVGGGILRDLFVCEIPLIFRKHIYLIPTILGAVIYTYAYPVMPKLTAMLLAIAFILVVRLLAILRHWNLPTPGRRTDRNRMSEHRKIL